MSDEDPEHIINMIHAKLEKTMKEEAEKHEDRLASNNVLIATINTPDTLAALFREYNRNGGIETGAIVRWKPGMRNRTVGGPFIVVEILPRDQCPRLKPGDHEGVSPYSPHYLEHADCRVAYKSPSDDGEILMYWIDSARLERVPKTEIVRA